jgi:hypothetical protein
VQNQIYPPLLDHKPFHFIGLRPDNGMRGKQRAPERTVGFIGRLCELPSRLPLLDDRYDA